MQSVRKGRVSLVETATDEIRGQIVNGTWPVGQPHPARERALRDPRGQPRLGPRSRPLPGALRPPGAPAGRRHVRDLRRRQRGRPPPPPRTRRTQPCHPGPPGPRRGRRPPGRQAPYGRPTRRYRSRAGPPQGRPRRARQRGVHRRRRRIPRPGRRGERQPRPRRHLPLAQRRPARGTPPRRLPGHRHRGPRPTRTPASPTPSAPRTPRPPWTPRSCCSPATYGTSRFRWTTEAERFREGACAAGCRDGARLLRPPHSSPSRAPACSERPSERRLRPAQLRRIHPPPSSPPRAGGQHLPPRLR